MFSFKKTGRFTTFLHGKELGFSLILGGHNQSQCRFFGDILLINFRCFYGVFTVSIGGLGGGCKGGGVWLLNRKYVKR